MKKLIIIILLLIPLIGLSQTFKEVQEMPGASKVKVDDDGDYYFDVDKEESVFYFARYFFSNTNPDSPAFLYLLFFKRKDTAEIIQILNELHINVGELQWIDTRATIRIDLVPDRFHYLIIERI